MDREVILPLYVLVVLLVCSFALGVCAEALIYLLTR